MTYLVDVNVLSEPTKPAPDAKVMGWLTANEGDLVVDSIRRKGHILPLLHGMIAATALLHGLTVATRNIRDFQQAGAKVFDPFA